MPITGNILFLLACFIRAGTHLQTLLVDIVQDAAERTPLFGRGIASGGEGIVEQRYTCRFQCTPWRGRENIGPLLLRSL